MQPPPKPPQKVNDAIRETARDVVQSTIFERRPYLKMAFANPYNLSLLIGGVAASVLTMNPLPALLACGGEALWLLHAPESKTLRRLLWDPRFEKVRLALEAQERAERMKYLPQKEKDRVNTLVAKEYEIQRLANENPSFTGDLLRNELVKTHKLVDSFLQVALTVSRYNDYLQTVDFNALEKDRERYQQRAASEKLGEQERTLARKNFEVIMKRVEKLRDIRSYLNVARAQLDLIENSFQLIADQIVTMQSPGELSGQLDDLLDGVESIQQTAADTEKMLNALEA
ncbi:MAG TPA: hypothetical protein VGR02_02945 [Thermoanaerobaculia bacterium]|nr:hypothetical protein [Thermoanaerobaculia bacterium]